MVFSNNLLLGAAGQSGGYEIDQSIRFNDNDSAYMSRTMGTATDSNVWTVSLWVKRGVLGLNTALFSAYIGANDTGNFQARFNSSDKLSLSGYYTNWRTTTSVFRDPSAFLHIVIVVNTDEVTADDRIKVYVNGVEETSFTTKNNPSSGANVGWNRSGNHEIGRNDEGNSNYLDGYLSEFNFIDGQALAPTDFGETNDDGVWIPKAYTGTYGTNGFYITGEDSADLGADYSGNGNDFASSGLTSDDQITDTPTDNHATLMPIWKSSSLTLSDGNLQQSGDASNRYAPLNIAIPQSGKFYVEFNITTGGGSDASTLGLDSLYRNLSSGEIGNSADGWGYRRYNGTKYHNSVSSSYGSSINTAGVVGIAVDADNGKIWFSEGGTWLNSGDPAAGTGEAFSGIDFSSSTSRHLMGSHASFGTAVGVWNTASTSWTYTPPTGFSALSTANLPGPAIADGSAYFQATTYTGAGYPTEVNQSGNSTFQPDFVWVKRRNAATTHDLFDAVRGVSSQLYSNLTNAEGTVSNAISFDADGFTAAADPITGDTGSSGNTFVGWQWLAANGTASNSDGSITSTVSANTTTGFSYCPRSRLWRERVATIGHGLSQAPDMVIRKAVCTSEVFNWWVWHQGLSGGTYSMKLNDTSAQAAVATVYTALSQRPLLSTLGANRGPAAIRQLLLLLPRSRGLQQVRKIHRQRLDRWPVCLVRVQTCGLCVGKAE